MKSVCVFCGSSMGKDAVYLKAASDLGYLLASSNISLIYGGANVGLMGEIANIIINNGGEVIGVIPKFLQEKEIAHQHLTKLHIVDTMHERKAKMAELADGFIAMPGGLGTLEEFFEILTWAQLGIHGKPCGILNTEGYYDKLMEFLDNSVAQKFIKPEHRNMIINESNPRILLNKLKTSTPNIVDKWISIRNT